MGKGRGIRTRVILVASLVLVIATITGACLLIVRDRMQQQVVDSLSADLKHSVETFQNLEAQRRAGLQHENTLLADLPNLRSLMTTSDQRTIADGAVQFWKLSANDLFALANPDGHVLVAYTQGDPANAKLQSDLEGLILDPSNHYLLTGGRLFEFSIRPLYFGSETSGTLLGYVISGYAIDHNFMRQVSQASDADATFLSTNDVLASTLLPARQNDLRKISDLTASGGRVAVNVSIGKERYLATTEDLSNGSAIPLHLVVLKSFDKAERAMHEINRLVSAIGLLALIVGSGLMLVISGMLTRPLEQLAQSVRAFGTGNVDYTLPDKGPQEVRELSQVFAGMRNQIQQTNRALLESERLATIGRMASSVSHDLRHYLAAVYANAEFLASSRLSDQERAELFNDIQIAVHGTTELIESLLIFSRTDGALQRSHVQLASLVERAVAILKSHPDAEGVTLRAEYIDPATTAALLDAKQMERAIYNLLLNACQSTRISSGIRAVTATIGVSPEELTVTITDNGPGVPKNIRESLFEPFVSQGKQKGTGLGLTLAARIAKEHDGYVKLVSSRAGETVFLLSVSRGIIASPSSEARERSSDKNKMIVR